MDNQYQRKSLLDVTSSYQNGKTVLENASFTAPFKVMHPFYQQDGTMELMIVSVSAGLMAGDVQEILITVKDEAKVTISAQAFEKIHRMNAGFAQRQTTISVGQGAQLCYSPVPVIPFKDSAFKSKTRVDLVDESAAIAFSEIITGGRSASGELFLYQYYHSLTDIYRAGKLLYRDNARYQLADFALEQMGMMEGYSHLLNMVVIAKGINKTIKAELQRKLEQDWEWPGGCSLFADSGINIKAFGRNSQELLQLYAGIMDFIALSNAYIPRISGSSDAFVD